jgi:WD40 repeat protein
VTALRFSRDGATLYGAGLDGAVRAWDLQKDAGGRVRVLTRHAQMSRTLALSPDERTVASGSADGSVHVVDLASGRVRVWRGAADETRHVAFSPDGKWLAAASWDGTIRLWEVASGRAATLRGHHGKVHRVAFSPDGKWLASSGLDGSIGLWDVAVVTKDPVPPSGLATWLARTTSATVETDAPLMTRARPGAGPQAAP